MKTVDFGNNKQEEAAGVDKEKQSHIQPNLTFPASEPVQQENGKQKGEEMERGVSCWW